MAIKQAHGIGRANQIGKMAIGLTIDLLDFLLPFLKKRLREEAQPKDKQNEESGNHTQSDIEQIEHAQKQKRKGNIQHGAQIAARGCWKSSQVTRLILACTLSPRARRRRKRRNRNSMIMASSIPKRQGDERRINAMGDIAAQNQHDENGGGQSQQIGNQRNGKKFQRDTRALKQTSQKFFHITPASSTSDWAADIVVIFGLSHQIELGQKTGTATFLDALFGNRFINPGDLDFGIMA